jgi:polar amino acid transport system substrate-binding protein
MEQEDTLQFILNSPQAINPEIFQDDSDDLAQTILHNYCRDIEIEGNMLRITIK